MYCKAAIFLFEKYYSANKPTIARYERRITPPNSKAYHLIRMRPLPCCREWRLKWLCSQGRQPGKGTAKNLRRKHLYLWSGCWEWLPSCSQSSTIAWSSAHLCRARPWLHSPRTWSSCRHASHSSSSLRLPQVWKSRTPQTRSMGTMKGKWQSPSPWCSQWSLWSCKSRW